MQRRTLLVATGGTVLGVGAVLGTEAFTTVEAERDATIAVTDDANALLALDRVDGSANSDEYVRFDDGTLVIDVTETDEEGKGLNKNAVTEIGELLEITNQGTQNVGVFIQPFETADGVKVDFRAGDGSIVGADSAARLDVGSTLVVEMVIDVGDVDVDDDDLEIIRDEEVTIEADADTEPSGSVEDGQVSTASDLNRIADSEDEDAPLDGDYELVDDIDASDADLEPIGDDPNDDGAVGFSGTFDGRGRTIFGAEFVEPIDDEEFDKEEDDEVAALFNFIEEEGQVRGLELRDFTVKAKGTTFNEGGPSALAAKNSGEVADITVRNADIEGKVKVAGLVADNDGTIRNASAEDIRAFGEIGMGGLVATNPGTIERCFASGDVDRTRSDGGDSSMSGVGGLVGENTGEVLDSYSLADVTTGRVSEGLYGGLVGDDGSGEPAKIERSFAAGKITATEEAEDPDEDNVGGLTGEYDEEFVEDSYWDIVATGEDESGAGEGFDTDEDEDGRADEMTGSEAEDNLDGFDFEKVWETTDGYPKLR
jgi:hypothetical protein